MNECTAILSIFPLQGDETQIIRSNRMHTLQSGFTRDRPVYLGTCTGLLSCSVPFEDGEWQFGSFTPTVARILVNADWHVRRHKRRHV